MKRHFLLIIILLQFTAAQTFAKDLSDQSYYHILKDINTFSSFFPRTENSKGESASADFIEKRLKEKDIEYTRYDLSKSDVVNSGSVTIDAILPGKSGNEIFMIFPLNYPIKSVQGRDGSANLASALFLVEELQKLELPQKVHIIFMGAEYGKNSSYPIGTKDYLSNYYPELNSAFFYFDFQFTPSSVTIAYSGTGANSPLWLLKKSVNALDNANISYSSRPGINLINRLKLNDKAEVVDGYFNNDYPVIQFEGNYSDYYIPKKKQLSELNTFFLELSLNGGGLIPSNQQWDSHYLFLKLNNYKIFISETNYVVFLLVLISLITLYPIIANKRFKKYLKTIFRHIWNIPVIFFIMFLLLWISTIIINVIINIQAFPTLWEMLPFHFLALKITISLFIFLLTLRLFKGIHFSRRGSFYSAAAMIFIIVDLLVLISIDIAFSYYLMPVLIFTFAFTIFKNRWTKFIFLFLSVLVLLGGTINIFLLDAKHVLRLVLLSPVTGNLIITANLIPIALMIFRLQFLFHVKNKKKAKYITLAGDIFLGIISISLFIYLATLNPYTNDRLQPVLITENIYMDDGTSQISFTSPKTLGEFHFSTSSKNKTVNTSEKSYTIYDEKTLKTPKISISDKSFLNRTRHLITINSPEKPGQISAVLKGKKEILIFDSNFHVSSIDENTAKFLIDANPDIPLELSFTLANDFQGEMSIQIYFNTYPGMAMINSVHFSAVHNIVFEKKISIGNED